MSLDGISHNGRFCVLAIDHRDSLRKFLSPDDLDAVSADELTALKVDIVGELAPMATGVMLEPEYSIPQVADAGALPSRVGFVAALEAQGYLGDLGSAPTTVLAGCLSRPQPVGLPQPSCCCRITRTGRWQPSSGLWPQR